jgi:hypothetical protein
VERPQFGRLKPKLWRILSVKSEKQRTVIPGADRTKSEGESDLQGSFDLQPDPAGLRDLAERFREDAEFGTGSGVKEHFLKCAEQTERRAEAVEAAALWMAPTFL